MQLQYREINWDFIRQHREEQIARWRKEDEKDGFGWKMLKRLIENNPDD